jgi:hypothetical protein
MGKIIPTNPDALLRRRDTAEALTAMGFPITEATLATKATRGGGPPYRSFGRTPLYRWGDSLTWAQLRLTAPRGSTSEADLQRNRSVIGPRDPTPVAAALAAIPSHRHTK